MNSNLNENLILFNGSTFWDFIQSNNYAVIFLGLGILFLLIAILKKTKFWERDESIGNKVPFTIAGIFIAIGLFFFFQPFSKETSNFDCSRIKEIQLLSCKENDQFRLNQIEEVLLENNCKVTKSNIQPPLKAINNNPTSVIRYFNKDDLNTAKSIAKLIKKQTGIKILIADMTRYYSDQKENEMKHNFEIWLNNDK